MASPSPDLHATLRPPGPTDKPFLPLGPQSRFCHVARQGATGRNEGSGPARGDRMTNGIAIGLGALILALIGLDIWLDAGMIVFLGRKFVDLVQHVAFWR